VPHAVTVTLIALSTLSCSSGTSEDSSEANADPSAGAGAGGSGAGGQGGMPGGHGGAASGATAGMGGDDSGGSESAGGNAPDDVVEIAGNHVRFDDTVSPTATLDVTSPFGPRLQQSKGFAYDFHRGIDIAGPAGTRINAIADGVVHDTFSENEPGSAYPSGGNVVILRHEADVPLPFHGEEYTTYYSIYMHLRSLSVTKGKIVNAGQRVGEMGKTGATEFVHLHLETRIGTTCSLNYQAANPEAQCASYGFDPHVNPFVFIDYDNADDLQPNVGLGTTTTTLSVVSPRSELDLNSLRINGVGVDINLREGIDRTNMDNPSFESITVTPDEFISASTEYGLSIEIENDAIPVSPDPDWTTIVEIYDIWGGGKMLRYGATQ